MYNFVIYTGSEASMEEKLVALEHGEGKEEMMLEEANNNSDGNQQKGV